MNNDQPIPADKMRELHETIHEIIAPVIKGMSETEIRELVLDSIVNYSPQPTSGLLGRWATNSYGKQVLITADKPSLGRIETAYIEADGSTYEQAEDLDDLTFPEQTTRAQDVPAGEAWLVDVDDGDESATNIPAVKKISGMWGTSGGETGGVAAWCDGEVTLITPLIPARPLDTEQRTAPETVTTKEQYEALPGGSIVALPDSSPFVKTDSGVWKDNHSIALNIFGVPRHVLRYGWGE